MSEYVKTSCINYQTMPEPETAGNPAPWGWHLVLNLYELRSGKDPVRRSDPPVRH